MDAMRSSFVKLSISIKIEIILTDDLVENKFSANVTRDKAANKQDFLSLPASLSVSYFKCSAKRLNNCFNSCLCWNFTEVFYSPANHPQARLYIPISILLSVLFIRNVISPRFLIKLISPT